MNGGPTPLRIVFYRGYRNPNDIGAGLMGFSGNGLAGWRRLATPPVFGVGNTYGHLRCVRTEHEYDHVLILNEITLRCY